MTLQEISNNEVVQRCASCDHENRIPLTDLKVGVERDEQVEDDIVPLPECPACQSREFLIRSPTQEQEYPAQQASAGHLHRLLVDALHAHLVEKGHVVQKLKDKTDHIFTRPIATETMARFFDKGLKLSARAVEQLHGKEQRS